MRKFFLIILSVILFLAPSIALADDTGTFNFNAQYNLFSGSLKDRIKCYQNVGSGDANWYCSYTLSADKLLYVNNFSSSFVSSGSDTENCGDASGCLSYDCNWMPISSDGRTMQCIGVQDDANSPTELYRYYLSNTSFVSLDFVNAGSAMVNGGLAVSDRFHISNLPLISWYRSGDANPRYTVSNNLNNKAGAGAITLPVSAQGTMTDMQLSYCGNYYHWFIRNETSQTVTDYIFDYDLNYQRSYTFDSTYVIGVEQWGVWADQTDQTIYLVTTNGTLGASDIPVISFHKYSCNNDGTLSEIYISTYNQTVIEPTANLTDNRYIQKPFLTKDTNDVYHLFYEFRDGASYTTNVSVEESGCEDCSAFLPQDECQGNYQKFNRTCPSYTTCTNTTYWTATTYCGIIQNETLGIYKQEYYNYFLEIPCETDLVRPPREVSCRYKDKIPVDCTNISVTITNIPDFYNAGVGDPDGNWTMTNCNPDKTSSCTAITYSCSDLNHTSFKTYTGYIAGQDATASASLKVDAQCENPLLFDRWINVGVTNYRLRSNFKLECDIPYTAQWLCDVQGNYEQYQQIDGTFTNETYCPNGCNNETGRCFVTPLSNPNKGTSLTYWVNFLFAPNDDQKIIHSFLWSILAGAGVSIGILSFTKGSKRAKDVVPLFMLFFGIGMIIFTVIEWLPLAYAIVVATFGLGGLAFKLLK